MDQISAVERSTPEAQSRVCGDKPSRHISSLGLRSYPSLSPLIPDSRHPTFSCAPLIRLPRSQRSSPPGASLTPALNWWPSAWPGESRPSGELGPSPRSCPRLSHPGVSTYTVRSTLPPQAETEYPRSALPSHTPSCVVLPSLPGSLEAWPPLSVPFTASSLSCPAPPIGGCV